MGDLAVCGHLGNREKEIRVFYSCEIRMGVTRTVTLDFWRVDFGLFRVLVYRIPREAALKRKVAQEGRTFFKKEILKMQELAVIMCKTMSQ